MSRRATALTIVALVSFSAWLLSLEAKAPRETEDTVKSTKTPHATQARITVAPEADRGTGGSAGAKEDSDQPPRLRHESNVDSTRLPIEAPAATDESTRPATIRLLQDGRPASEFHLRIWRKGADEGAREYTVNDRYALSPEDAGASAMACTRTGSSDVLIIPSPIAALDMHAVATSSVIGTVRGNDGTPVAGAEVSLRQAGLGKGLDEWLDRIGHETTASAKADLNGNFEAEGLRLGQWKLTAEAFGFASEEKEVLVRENASTNVSFDLAPLDGVRVVLVEAEEWPPGALEVAETAFGTRVTCDADGSAWIPLAQSASPLDISAFLPNELHLNAYWPDGLPDGVSVAEIWLGGGPPLNVAVVGETTIEGPLILSAQGIHATGYELWVTRQLEPGDSLTLECFSVGPVWLSLNYKKDDFGVEIVRSRASLERGRGTTVALTVPDEPRVLRIAHADGRAMQGLEAYLATPDTARLSPAGGTTDQQGEVHVPTQQETTMSLSGYHPQTSSVFADIQFVCDWNLTRKFTVDVGKLIRSSVELRDAFTGTMVGDQVVYVSSMDMAFPLLQDSTRPNGDPAEFDWYSAGPPFIELPGEDIWSPRELVQIQPGLNTLEVRRRTGLTLRGPGASVVELRHVETGLDLAGLLGDPGVGREVVSGQEVRLTGVPSGTYRVRFGPDAEWQGPHAAGPVDEVVVVRAE